MKFNVINRDGAGRVGEIFFNDNRIITPNLLFIDTSRFRAPDFAEFLIKNSNNKSDKISLKFRHSIFSSNYKEKNEDISIINSFSYPKDVSIDMHKILIDTNKNIDKKICIIPPRLEILDDLKHKEYLLFIISNSYQLLQQQNKFVDFLIKLREKVGYEKIIYAPCIGSLSNLALLCYMGVDLFDSTNCILSARNDVLFFPNGNFDKKHLKELPCSCPSCVNFRKKPSMMKFEDILQHNYFSVLNEIQFIRNSIYRGVLRELVESRISSNPKFDAVLKILDVKYYDFLEERTPINRKNFMICTTKHSLKRSEIKRFQNRVQNRYIKPSCANILLILPCSAKKPYSFSKTHKLIKEKISFLKNPHIIHELVITSPLGIVPKELELIYPASRYDISVSGYWDEDEKITIKSLLKNFLKSNNYKNIVVHVPASIQDFIVDIIKNPKISCIDTPLSDKSLDKLSNILEDITNQFAHVNYFKRLNENILSLASYQFGKEIAKELLENSEIKGRYPFQKIIKNKKQLGMLTLDRGIISLTLDGAKILASFKKYWVDIYDDFNLVGSVFAPGIKDADKNIRVGDEVVVLKNGNICGVGVSQMNGLEMIQLDHGEAVKIRHRC